MCDACALLLFLSCNSLILTCAVLNSVKVGGWTIGGLVKECGPTVLEHSVTFIVLASGNVRRTAEMYRAKNVCTAGIVLGFDKHFRRK